MLAFHRFASTTTKGVSARVLRALNKDTYKSPQLQELELRFASDGVLGDIEPYEKEGG